MLVLGRVKTQSKVQLEYIMESMPYINPIDLCHLCFMLSSFNSYLTFLDYQAHIYVGVLKAAHMSLQF